MNILLWVLQILAALVYGASGVMKVFMFDKVSEGVPSFGALPRQAWMTLGILELVCTVGLIVPAAFHWKPALTVVAAAALAIEGLVFVGVHVQYREIPPIILSCVQCNEASLAGCRGPRHSRKMGRLIPAGTGFEYYRHVRIPADARRHRRRRRSSSWSARWSISWSLKRRSQGETRSSNSQFAVRGSRFALSVVALAKADEC